MKEVVFSKEAPAAVGPYSHAIDCGNLVFLSGQVPLVPETGAIAEGGIEGQARQMFANIKAVLQSCGMTFDNVVKTTVFLKDMEDFAEMNRIYQTFFAADCPARSAVQVARLPKDVLVEIEAIAVL